MNQPSYTDPAAPAPPMADPSALFGANMNQLQFALQLVSLLSNQNPLAAVNMGGGPSSSAPPGGALPQLQAGGPNLLALLGMQQNGFSANGVGGPVGTCENDEELLVQALRESGSKGLTYKQALDNLHAVSALLLSPLVLLSLFACR